MTGLRIFLSISHELITLLLRKNLGKTFQDLGKLKKILGTFENLFPELLRSYSFQHYGVNVDGVRSVARQKWRISVTLFVLTPSRPDASQLRAATAYDSLPSTNTITDYT